MKFIKSITKGSIALLAIFLLLTATAAPGFAEDTEGKSPDTAPIVAEGTENETSETAPAVADDTKGETPETAPAAAGDTQDKAPAAAPAATSDTEGESPEEIERRLVWDNIVPGGRKGLLRASGNSITYTSAHIGGASGMNPATTFTVTGSSDYKGYAGLCSYVGIDAASSGSATVVSKVSNNSKVAKMVYQMVYQRKWLESPRVSQSIYGTVPGVTSSTTWSLGQLVNCVVQIDNMGASTFLDAWGDNNITAPRVVDWYNSYNVSGITVPSGFEMYKCNAGSNQPFYIYTLKTTGKVNIRKTSSNTSITG